MPRVQSNYKSAGLAAGGSPYRFKNWREGNIETLMLEGAEGPRMIEGIASSPTVNAHKYSLDSKGMFARLPVPLLYAHGKDSDGNQVSSVAKSMAIGKVILIRKSPIHILVQAVLDDSLAADAAWKLIESGEARAFSGAAKHESLHLAGVVEGVKYYDRWELREVSVCRTGANPDCHFTILRK